ncbi:MAG: hypothetical protein M0Z36_10720 [Thermaerobacter sp.]|nr:hypothetical protein [Thermaerobacter sp.]
MRNRALSLHLALLDDLGPAEALKIYIERLSRVGRAQPGGGAGGGCAAAAARARARGFACLSCV